MKLHKLPCKPYVRKYVAPDLSNRGVLRIKNRVVRTIRDKTQVTKFFEKCNDSTSFIMVEMNAASLYTLYSLHNTLAQEFRDKLFSVMAYAVHKGIPAREAARDFLAMYGITPDEYDLDSAYRTWQRRKDKYLNPTKVRNPDQELPVNLNQVQLKLYELG
jgi:hypothetical protein